MVSRRVIYSALYIYLVSSDIIRALPRKGGVGGVNPSLGAIGLLLREVATVHVKLQTHKYTLNNKQTVQFVVGY